MKRIPEPELMNTPEQARAYAGADFSEPHNMFVEKFNECFPGEAVENFVLDLGCGPADISIRFAKAHPDCKIHGIDGAQQMLLIGQSAINRAGLSDRIQVLQGFIPDLELPEPNYSTIISNSLLHHLHHPDVLWSCIKQYSTANTRIFIMDLIRPDSPEVAKKLVDIYACEEPEILRQDFFNSLCAAFVPEEVAGQLHTAGISSLNVEVISDRHMVIYGRIL